MKKFIIIAIIGLLGIAALFGSAEEDTHEVTETDAKTEETNEVEEKEKQDKAAAEKEQAEKEQAEKEQAEKEQAEKEKAEKEIAEKEKAEAEKAAKEQQEKEEKLAAEKAAEEKAAKEKAEAAEKAEAEKVAKEKEIAEIEQLHLSIMQENMSMYVDITFDKESKIYKMTPTNEQLISEIEMLPLGIGWAEWQQMVDGIVSMSKTNSDNLGEGYSITLINPLNEENIILWVMDGEVIYNVVDEL